MKINFSSVWIRNGALFFVVLLSGCSSSKVEEPSYDELLEVATSQRETLNEGAHEQLRLAAEVAAETQAVAEMGIATGALVSRKPFVGVRINDPR